MRQRRPAGMHLEGHAIVVEYDQELPSLANTHAHWRTRQKHRKQQRGLAKLMMQAKCPRAPRGPMVIRITRIAPRLLDDGDNASMSAKGVKDGVADWLGLDDRDPSLKWWPVGQEKRSKTHRVRIEVYPGGCWGCGATGKTFARTHDSVCSACNGRGIEAA